MTSFPIPAPAFKGHSLSVDIGSTFDWYRQGWAIFLVNPGTWIAMTAILLAILLGAAFVPLIGLSVVHFSTPALEAGLLIGCHQISRRENLAIRDLFAGLQRNGKALTILGALYMLALTATTLLVAMLADGGAASGTVPGKPLNTGFGRIAVAALLWLLLAVPVAMAICFAPALVVFNNMPPIEALQASFQACLKNVCAFLVSGLIGVTFCFLAALSIGLGLLVLGPVLAGAIYASYRDIFVAA